MASSKLFGNEGENNDGGKKSSRLFDSEPIIDQSQLNFQSAILQQGFKGDSKYDAGLTFGSNQNNLRAKNQPFLHELANGLVTGVANIVPQTLGNLAAMGDLEDYYNQDNEVGNSITRAMMELQQDINATLPIHQPDNVDMGSSEFWTAAVGRDLVSSMGGFVLTGEITGAALNIIGKGAQLISGLNSLGKAGKAAAAVIQATGLNQAEGIQSAIGVYDSLYKSKVDEYRRTRPELSEEDADTLAKNDAASGAALTINLNRLTIPLNLTSSLAFLRTPKSDGALLENPTTKSFMKGILGEGIQETAEEEINLIAEKYGQSEGKMSVNGAIKSIFSQEGLASGLLGFIGGAGQTAGTTLLNKANGSISEDQKRFSDQQSFINELENIIGPSLGTTLSQSVKTAQDQIHLNNEMQTAQEEGDYDKAASIGQSILTQQSMAAFNTGMAGKLVDIYKNVANLSLEDAARKGLDIDQRSDDFYKKKSLEAVSKIDKLEKIYNKIPNVENKEQIFYTQAQRLQYNTILTKLNSDIKISQAELEAEKANRGLTQDFDNANPLTQTLQSFSEMNALIAQQEQVKIQALELDRRLAYIQSSQYAVDKKTKADKRAEMENLPLNPLAPEELAAISNQMTNPDKIEASTFLAADHKSPEEVLEDLSVLSDANQVNPIIVQQSQIKADKAIENLQKESAFDLIRSKTPVTITVGGEQVNAVPLDDVEKAIIGTNHSHVVINGDRFKFVTDNSSLDDVKTIQVEQPKDITAPNNFLEDLLQISNEVEEQLATIKDSFKLDIDKKIVATTVQQFQLIKDKNVVKLGKDGNPIEKTDLQTFNNIPFDFKALNDPLVNKGTRVFLTHGKTNYNNVEYDTIFVNLKNPAGQLIPITQMQTSKYGEYALELMERVMQSETPIETTIVDKYTDKTNMVSTSNNFSLRDLEANSSEHLPNGKVYIGQIYGDKHLVSNLGDVTPKFTPIRDPKKYEGRSFILLTDPQGNTFPSILFQPQAKDVKIGGKKASSIVIDGINQFKANNEFRGAEKNVLRRLKQDFEVVKAELSVIIDIQRKPLNTFNIGIDTDPMTGEVGFYVNIKGKRIFDQDIIEKSIGERPLTIKAEQLVANKPISINGVNFNSYVDFLIDTEALQTNLYTKQPFRDARLKLDTIQILDPSFQNNNEKMVQATKYGSPEMEIAMPDTDNNVAYRKQLDDSYKVWDKSTELAWLNKNLPNIPVEVLGNTVDIYEKFGQKAFGAFSEGVVYLANNTEIGTSYHEAFHAVFRTYLDSETQSQYLKGTNEEALAEEFRAYMITEGMVKPSNNIVVRFFNDIISWTKDLLGLDRLNNLFYKINAGKFAKGVPTKTLNNNIYRLIDGLETSQLNPFSVQQDLVDTISSMSLKGSMNDIKSYFKKLAKDATDFRKSIFTSAVSNFKKLEDFSGKQFSSLSPLERYLKTVTEGVNSLGFGKSVDVNEYSSLLNNLLRNTTSIEEVIDLITLESKSNPGLSQIVEDLNSPDTSEVTKNLFSLFTQPSMQKTLSRLKENVNGDLDVLLADPFYKNSLILNTLKNGNLDSINFSQVSLPKRIETFQTKFENMKMGVFSPFALKNSLLNWTLPVLGNSSENIVEEGILSLNTEFGNWLLGNIQDEYSRIVEEANNIFKGKEVIEGFHINKGNAGPALFFNNFQFLNELLWVKTPNKFSDVNLIDLNTIDFQSPEFMALLNENMVNMLASERTKLRSEGLNLSELELNWFIANSIYSTAEVTKLSVGDIAGLIKSPKNPDLENISNTLNGVYEISPSVQGEIVTNINQLQELENTGNAIPSSLEVALSWKDNNDTFLPLDFPSISEVTKLHLLPEVTTPDMLLSYEGMEEFVTKNRGKKIWNLPSFQNGISENAIAGDLNINELTSRSLNLVSDEASFQLAFINQPILKNLSVDYFKTKNLQLSVNNVLNAYKINDGFVDVDNLGTFTPKAFVMSDLMQSLKSAEDSKEILKSFLFYRKNSEIVGLPQNADLFSDFSNQFDGIRTVISNAFNGVEFTQAESDLISKEFKSYLLTTEGSFFNMSNVEKEELMLNSEIFEQIESEVSSAEQLWDTYLTGDSQLIGNFVKYDFLKNGFNNPKIHANFYNEFKLSDKFRDLKPTLDVELDNRNSEMFLDQFVRNNFKSLNYVAKGDPQNYKVNKPLYLVNNGNLLKFVDGKYTNQVIPAFKDYAFGTDNNESSLKQSLMEDQNVIFPTNASKSDVIFEYKKYCNSL